MGRPDDYDVNRREWVAGAGASAALVGLPQHAQAATPQAATPQAGVENAGTDRPVTAKVGLTVNGQERALELDTRTSLLDAVRDHLHLTGSKKGCDHGQCGACTMIVDGRRINACLTLAIMHQGAEITTIEGIGQPGNLHPMQAAFIKHDGYQCGFCTPGQICSSLAVLGEIKAGIPSHVTADLNAPMEASAAEIRERMSGNICRCGAYSNIVEAVTEIAGRPA